MERKTDLIREKFDAWAPSWDAMEGWDENVLEDLLSKIPQGHYDSILDLACGTGVMSKRLQEHFHGQVLGIDLSAKMIEAATKKFANEKGISFLTADFYDFTQKGFDLILLHNAYPHFLDVDGLCEKASEALNPGGIFAIMHSCGREELNSHHAGNAAPISFLLDSPKKEAMRFAKHFKTLSYAETKTFYYFILQKK